MTILGKPASTEPIAQLLNSFMGEPGVIVCVGELTPETRQFLRVARDTGEPVVLISHDQQEEVTMPQLSPLVPPHIKLVSRAVLGERTAATLITALRAAQRGAGL